MAQFRTAFQAKLSKNLLDYSSSSLFIGSCFSNNISSFLSWRKFGVNTNHFGILFNPISIGKALNEIMDKRSYSKEDLVFHDELFHSMNHHSDYSNPESEEVIESINRSINEAHTSLKEASFLFITFGTAWVYEYESEVVANCHKIPNKKFEKRLLEVHEIKMAFLECIKKIKAFNPKVNIVFTISPVRHLKDGFVENNLSKSILRTAIHEIQRQFSTIEYFPAYEIVQDDLRDYRFYKTDLVHPSEEAIKYIWEQFKTTYVDPNCLDLMKRIENLQAAINHKPRFPQSDAYQKHLAFIEKEQEQLKKYF